MKTMKINGVTYERINPNTKLGRRIMTCPTESLYTAYTNPSEAKRSIYQYWFDKSWEMDGYDYGVASHNCMMFTVAWYTEDAYFLITPSHNYVVYVGADM